MKAEKEDFELAKKLFLDGLDYLDTKNFALAEERFLNSLEILPGRESTLSNLIIAQLQNGKTESARENCELLIKLNPKNYSALNQAGLIYHRLQKYGEAIYYFRRAIAVDDLQFEPHLNLGNVLCELDRYEEALGHYGKVIEINRDNVDAYICLGNAFKNLNRFDRALENYRQALALAPDSAVAWTGLARLQFELGNFEEAEESYGKAHLIDGKLVEPLCGLAEVRGYRVEDRLVAQIESRIPDETLTNNERAQVHHAYAKICDELGRYDDAFLHFSESKNVNRSNFDLESVSSAYSALTRLFDRKFFEDRKNYGIGDERPVFIVGMPRSGTTLVEQILTSHAQIDGLGELRNVHLISKSLGGGIENRSEFAAAVRNLKDIQVVELANKYCEVFSRSNKKFLRLVDKNPHNFEMLGLIALLFPNAHVIHCRRDPMDTCVSMFTQKFNRQHGYNEELYLLGSYYREYEKLMDHWKNALPLKLFEFEYEKNIEDLESSSRAVISFLGLDWDPECLNYYRQNRRVATPSLWQVRQPLYSKSVGRWRHYDKYLGPLKKALGSS